MTDVLSTQYSSTHDEAAHQGPPRNPPLQQHHPQRNKALAAMARRRNGDTCRSCNNTGTTTRCSRCLLANCDGIKYCPACPTCDDSGTVGCTACGAQGGDEDADCSHCKGAGRVPCRIC